MQMSSKERLVRKTSSNNKDANSFTQRKLVIFTVIEDDFGHVGSKTYS